MLCGGGAARAEDWATAGLDGAHARLTAERSGASFAPRLDGGERWRGVLASPVVADGYVVTVDSKARCARSGPRTARRRGA